MNLVKRLTSNYKRDPTSNIGKLLRVFDLELDELKTALQTVKQYRKIDSAIGYTLDLIGENVGQMRGSSDDIQYRLMLKTRIRANMSNGEIDVFNDVLDVLLGDHFICVREVWNDDSYGNEPAALEVRYKNYFDMIRSQYQDIEDDPWYLDGKYKLDGSRKLDGGLTFTYADFEAKIIAAMNKTKEMAGLIKAGGVKVWWCEPLEVTNLVNIGLSTQAVIKSTAINGIESLLTTTNIIKSEVTQIPDFVLDGTVMLDGSLILNGERPLIIHSTSVNIVTA